jgi:hypothetical protein
MDNWELELVIVLDAESQLMIKLKRVVGALLDVSLLMAGLGWVTAMADPFSPETTLNDETFAQVRQQIKPQAGESRWMEIPWLIDVHEARQKAAAEGKPLFVYSGGGATGIGPC